MPFLPVEVAGFAAGPANGKSRLDVSKRRFIKFAVTLGSPIFAATIGGSRLPVAFAAYKALAAKSSVDFTASDFSIAPGYANLEPTEKANLAYWTGMTVAAVIADAYLDVPGLLHAAAYGPVARRTPSSRSLADLIGLDTTGRWHVIEAKARQVVTQRGRAAWKAQATTIGTIGGSAPATRSYSLARIGSRLKAELVDPPPIGHEATNLDVSSDSFRDTYYAPLRSWSRDGIVAERDGLELRLRLAAYDAIDAEFIWVGMEESRVDEGSHRGSLVSADRGEVEYHDAFIGRDGVAVLTSPEASLS